MIPGHPCLAAPSGDQYQALIFDWDGTLVDSRDLNHRSLEAALSDCGVALDPDWYWARQGAASPELLAEWETQFGRLPEPIEVIMGRCRQRCIDGAATLTVIEEHAEIARRARARGQLLGIGSNAADITLRAALDATGLGDLFDTVVSWSDVPPGRGKPHPDIFLLVAKQLGVDPAGCLVYEDADEGVTAALAAGMTVYHVRRGELFQPDGGVG